MANKYVTVPVNIRFDAIVYTGTLTVSGVVQYIKQKGAKIVTEQIAEKLGFKAVAGGWIGFAVSALVSTFALGMSLAGYTGMTVYTKCVIQERTHHQNGDVTVVTTCEPRSIERIKLY